MRAHVPSYELVAAVDLPHALKLLTEGYRPIAGGTDVMVLFEAGKFLIGVYIAKQGLESTYGAASSIVVVLIWVYYNAQIVIAGAEFTRVYAEHHGSKKPASAVGPF